MRLGTVFEHCTGKALNQTNKEGKLLDYITTSNLYWNRFELDSVKQMYFKESEIEKCTAMRSVHKTVTQNEHCRRRIGMVKNREV